MRNVDTLIASSLPSGRSRPGGVSGRLLAAVVVGLPLVVAACSEGTTADPVTPEFDHRPKHPAATEDISLIVEIRDEPIGVRSDDWTTTGNPAGLYIDGVDATAYINGLGNYLLYVKEREWPERKICFQYPDGAGTPFESTGGAGCDDGYISSGGADVEGGLQSMRPGDVITIRSQVTTVSDGYNWFLRYGRDCDANEVRANRVTVTAFDDDGDGVVERWTAAGTRAILCKLPVKGKSTVTEVAQYDDTSLYLTLFRQ